MSKTLQLYRKPDTEKNAGAIAQIKNPGDCVIVVRGVPRTIIMSCPDGCGETLTVNLDGRAGKAWRKYERNGKLSIYPSIWRDTGCRAHFIIWKDRILWCEPTELANVKVDEALIKTVFNTLPTDKFIHFELVADSLNEIPWDVIWACDELVHRGQAQVHNRHTFKRNGTYTPPKSTGRIDVIA